MFPHQDAPRSIYNTDYELEYDTFIFGLNSELNYYFNGSFAAGIGIGYEKVNNQTFLLSNLLKINDCFK